MRGIRHLLLLAVASFASAAADARPPARPVPFADDGLLKMLYDNRMHPQAVEHEGKVYIAWRGRGGLPHVRSYDLAGREFSEAVMVMTGLQERLKRPDRYGKDHHYCPVLWIDGDGYIHILSGCHGNTPKRYTSGDHVVSAAPGDISRWRMVDAPINVSVNYPKAHTIHDGRMLAYFRDGGHLASWTYRTSADGGRSWQSPGGALVDLDSPPQDGFMADQAGSYHTARASRDGRTLHVAFVWSDTDYKQRGTVQPPNPRYGRQLGPFARYNLYYMTVDLPTGRAFTCDGRELATPVRKKTADRELLIWDTEMRVTAAPPAIHLDEGGRPHFVLNVAGDSLDDCRFYYIRRRDGEWLRTPITRTPHPWNSCRLTATGEGALCAYVIAGDGGVSEEGMDRYGWGDSVEEWVSLDGGRHWEPGRDLTPEEGRRYQNVKFVSRGVGEFTPGLVLFYGWRSTDGPGAAYLWDGRE